MSDPSYGPTNESAADMYSDRLWLYGLAIGGLTYGIHACTFFSCGHFLLKRERTTMTYLLLAYIVALFIAGSLMFMSLTKLTELAFVNNREYPGGPVNWYNVGGGGYDVWTTIEDVAYFIAEILSDGLLLYRAWMIWNMNYYVVFFPFLVYLGVIGLGIPLMCVPNTWLNLRVVEAWFGCAAALNIIVTCLIVGRLLVLSYRTRTALGSEHGRKYASVASIVVESAAPCAAFNILYIVNYGGGSEISTISWPILSQVMCIAPQMILLRVALGQAFARGGVPSSARFTTSASTGRSPWQRKGSSSMPSYGGNLPPGGVHVNVNVEHGAYGSHPQGSEIVLQAMRFDPTRSLDKQDGDLDKDLSPASPYEARKVEIV